MVVMRGSLAFSHFRIERWLTQINYLVPQVNSLHAEFIHFVDLEAQLSPIESRLLNDLLHYGGYSTELISDFSESKMILVIPKIGTVSSWSNRATDVIHQCGLHQVRRVERGIAYYINTTDRLTWGDEQAIADLLHDPVNESVIYKLEEAGRLFEKNSVRTIEDIDIVKEGKAALYNANQRLGLSLNDQELDYVLEAFKPLGRNPTEVELITLIEFNAGYRLHKVFNDEWRLDDKLEKESLISIMRNTNRLNARAILAIHNDNTAIIESGKTGCFYPDPKSHVYQYHLESIANVLTSFPGHTEYNIGIGEEIRIGTAVGRGAKTKVGFCGYSVSNLLIPGFIQPWEINYDKPKEHQSALEFILQASINTAQFNSEYGRPNIVGYFRTYEQWVPAPFAQREVRGYHKPILMTGGLGTIRQRHIHVKPNLSEMLVVILGNPIMVSAVDLNQSCSDPNVTQIENPEMQRRCQEVIKACNALELENPISSIHAVSFRGIVNVLTELIQNEEQGISINVRDIPTTDSSLSSLEVWRNGTPERYILIIENTKFERFQVIAEREYCPFAMIGKLDKSGKIELYDKALNSFPVQLPTSMLFNKFSGTAHDIVHLTREFSSIDFESVDIEEALLRVLKLPCVADKTFLVTINDRTVSGLVARDAMIGPWQIPVADCAVTIRGFDTYQGEALAIGERSPLAIIDPIASARMAIGEAITNIAAANIGVLSDIRLLADWIGTSGYQDEETRLHDAVRAIGIEFCPALGLAMPVNQDSLSMQSSWEEEGQNKVVAPPLSLIISAYAPVMDVRRTLTPLLKLDQGETLLMFIDLSPGNQRLGQSALAQVFNQVGDTVPDVSDPHFLKAFFAVIQQLNSEGKLLAYHDRSDGGLIVSLCEMAFATHIGLQIDISELGREPISILFNEELGAVIQIRSEDVESILSEFEDAGLPNCYVIGTIDNADKISVIYNEKIICSYERTKLQQAWSETSFQLQSLRDNPRCAKKQFETIKDNEDPGLNASLTFDLSQDITIPMLNFNKRPRVAILREQGTHGHVEMAAAFDKALFECVDVHMNDLNKRHISLQDFKGLAVCGGFSFGDVLGAGQGWAKRILFNNYLKDQFEGFFNRSDTFTLGVSNGCQLLAGLKYLIPGAKHWPTFIQNYSEQFEARLCLVEVQKSASILLEEMDGSRIPVPVASKEGRTEFVNDEIQEEVLKQGLVTLRYVDNWGRKTKAYPTNPSGSPLGITGLTTPDGRVNILMPHPDRAFRTVQYSWHPENWGEDGPWLRIFRNARKWVG